MCFGSSGSVRGDEHPLSGEVRERVPDLLAVHDPLVTVAHGARREAGEVGAGAGLGEELTPHVFAGEHRPQRAVSQFVAAVRHHRGPGEIEIEEQHALRRRGAGLAEPGLDVALHPGLDAEAPESLGKVDPRQAAVVLRAAERHRVGRAGIVRGQQIVDECIDLGGVVGHGRSLFRGGDSAVDGNHRAGEVGAGPAREEDRGAGHVVGPADPTER